jgi:hypothetical protein
MRTLLIIAAAFTIGLWISPAHAEGRDTLGGTGETGANERQGAAQAQPGDRRGITMGRDEQDRGAEAREAEATDEQADESRGSSRHGDAPIRDPATR